MAPNYPRHTLAKFEDKPTPVDTILAWDCLGTKQPDTPKLVMWQLPVHTWKPLGFHMKMTELGWGNKSYNGILPKFTKIWSLWALEHEQKQATTCSTAAGTPVHARPRARALGQLPREAVKPFQAWAKALHCQKSEIILTGLQPPTTACGPGYKVSHSQIPCTHDLTDLLWSSPTH
jgi:hypothetical protein